MPTTIIRAMCVSVKQTSFVLLAAMLLITAGTVRADDDTSTVISGVPFDNGNLPFTVGVSGTKQHADNR